MKKITCVALALLVGLLSAAESQVAVTIYNDNLALVREVRSLTFEKGVQSFQFVDVAAKMDPTSVHFKSLSPANEISILEQNFEYDLVGTNRLLQKYIDLPIEVQIHEGETMSGTLLSSSGGDVVMQTDDGRICAIKAANLESIVFPSLPNGLMTRPTLVWLLNAPKTGAQDCEISYLTSGINWHAEYVAVVNDNDTKLDLAGWVSIDNNSGASYNKAKLKLVAGDIHRAPSPPQRAYKMMAMAAEVDAAQFEEKSFFEYHLYTLQRPATIKDRQIKQVSLFSPQTTKVIKVYSYDGERNEKKVSVTLEFKNSAANGLGMPLPRGKVRVYKNDADGAQEFIGEDAIDHTPKDETIRLTMGNAFDIVGERIVTDVKKISKRSRQQTVEITLRNHKKEKVAVKVIEHLYGDWQFIGQTPPVVKKTADRVEFSVEVPADGETTFKYTVLLTY